jgi:hypothetical protein
MSADGLDIDPLLLEKGSPVGEAQRLDSDIIVMAADPPRAWYLADVM